MEVEKRSQVPETATSALTPLSVPASITSAASAGDGRKQSGERSVLSNACPHCTFTSSLEWKMHNVLAFFISVDHIVQGQHLWGADW